MKVIRATVRAMTSSFRYPMFTVGYQPSLEVPPVSTIYGMLSSAKGGEVSLDDTDIGYTFTYDGKGIDLEKVYKLGEKGFNGSDIVSREYLYNCTLTLYLTNTNLRQYLKRPYYILRLGRQQDIAYVSEIKEVELEESDDVTINNTMVPYDGIVKGEVLALPTGYTYETSRDAINPIPYCIVTSPQKTSGYYDSELDKGVYMHAFNHG